MPFCRNCGAQLKDSQVDCPECGTRRTISTQPPAPPAIPPLPPPAAVAPVSVSAAGGQAEGAQGAKPADHKGRKGLKVILIVACLLFLGVLVGGLITYTGYRISRALRSDVSNAPASQVNAGRGMTSQEAPLEADGTIPNGWKVSRDVAGSFEVATPPDWQMGRDFFLGREKAETRKIGDRSVQAPPTGLALWGIERHDRQKMPQLPEGKRFQIRCSLVRDGVVCSVWRIKEPEQFTAEERNTMKRVGRTLRWVE